MDEATGRRSPIGLRWWIALLGFLAIAVTMNWEEHRAHILGVLPYLFLLACPLMHLFMHGSHKHGGGQENSNLGQHQH